MVEGHSMHKKQQQQNCCSNTKHRKFLASKKRLYAIADTLPVAPGV